MSLIQQNFYGLVMKSKFNSLLYKFLDENQDIILGTDNADTLAIMYESYRIGVGLLSLEASESCVQTYIDYIYKEYADYPKTIIAIVWVLLSAHKESHQCLRSTIRSLSNELKDYKSFHLWKRFLSAINAMAVYSELKNPVYNPIVVSKAETAEESMQQAQQAAIMNEGHGECAIHQTLVFPNVNQFNNNPAKVINYNKKK